MEDMLSGEYGKEDYWCTLRALRALCEFPMPDLAENIIFVMREGNYLEHKYEAIRALGTCTDNLKVVRALGDVVRTETNRYLILAAIESLDELKNGEAREDLIHALQNEDAEVRAQASGALLSFLSKEEAASTIIPIALKKGIETNRIPDNLIEALRRIDKEDRSICTEILNKELESKDREHAEMAEKILTELGGWAAVQRLSQRRSTLESLDKLLAESEEVVKSTFQDTILQARRNFYFAMGVNILVVLVGLVLVILAIFQLIQNPEKMESWIVPGGTGLVGVIINLYFNNPRTNAREDLTALINVNVIFLGFLRQLNEIDATFKHAYMEKQDFGLPQMRDTVQAIDNAMAHALNMTDRYLSTLKPRKNSKAGKSEETSQNQQNKSQKHS